MTHLWSGRVATVMAQYFTQVGNLGAFVSAHPNLNLTEREAVLLAHRLVQENVIEFVVTYNSGPGFGSAYHTYNLPLQDEIEYGALECLVHGFPFIRHHFQSAVVPLLQRSGSAPDGEMGSAFLIENGKILTARHCIVGHAPSEASSVELIRIDPRTIERILIPKDSRRDMAVAICRKTLECERNRLRLGKGFVLDEVMALGYPPIPGYLNVLSALRARVAGDLSEYLHSTTGNIAASEKPYLAPTRTHLMSARVKGGSSGGPVINKRGEVIGLISASPSSDSQEIDRLGFGTAIASSEIEEFLSEVANETVGVKEVNFKVQESVLQLERSGWWRD
jgi:serine protease Do